MNSVHEHHKPERFWKLTHYVFAFHDTTFQCAADGFSVSVHRGSLRDIVGAMAPRVA